MWGLGWGVRDRRRRSWQRRRSSRSLNILLCDLNSFYFIWSVCWMKRALGGWEMNRIIMGIRVGSR